MGYKLKITDDEGKEFMVEQADEEQAEVHNEELTPEETAKLKLLASKVDELLALLQPAQATDEKQEEVEEEVEEEADKVYTDEDVDDEDVEEDEDEDEKVIETKDSIKQSFGALPKTKTLDSSEEERQLEIEEAWRQRHAKCQ